LAAREFRGWGVDVPRAERYEIHPSVEESFSIVIPDREAAGMTTPAQIADYVMLHASREIHSACPSQIAFHRVRALLMTSFGHPVPKNASFEI
jgi:hypothetical protein